MIGIDTRKIATEYRLTQWAGIVQTRQSRGQSIKDFCAAEGISKNMYFYWQRKLRETACSEHVRQKSITENELVPSGWARIEPQGTKTSLTVEVGGCQVTVSDDTNPELLVKVCRALKSL